MTADLQGVIQEANPAAYTLLGVRPHSLKGKQLASYVAPVSRQAFRTHMLALTGIKEHMLYLLPKHGGLLYATLRVSPILDAGGIPVGLRWLVHGVISDPGAEMTRTRRIMEEVRDFAIFTMDAEGTITRWNAGAEIIFGYSAAEAIGQSGDIIFTPEDRAEGAPDQERGTASASGRAEDERWHIREDGSRLWGSGVLTALRDDVGGSPWYAKIVRDLTDRRIHEQREHSVATQLQASVQPAAPLSLPGLAIRSFYRPAFEYLSVGGDFFDAFPLSDGRSVLVVGDVSGKGVEAASQVSAIRNMLRFALYNGSGYSAYNNASNTPHPGDIVSGGSAGDVPSEQGEGTLAGSVAALSRTLSHHGLLAGFATMFVGIFDPDQGLLTYINCGQEAALVRHAATGQVEALRFTGPLLGLDADTAYTESQTELSPGDALVIFTDGLTDIGPNRTQMLGEEGVTELLEGSIAGLDSMNAQRIAEVVTARLVAAVNAQGERNVSDDVCLLVAVAAEREAGV